jgi:surface protein
MKYMFSGVELFNHEISNWDVSNVEDMEALFWNAWSFQGNLSGWDVCQRFKI